MRSLLSRLKIEPTRIRIQKKNKHFLENYGYYYLQYQYVLSMIFYSTFTLTRDNSKIVVFNIAENYRF